MGQYIRNHLAPGTPFAGAGHAVRRANISKLLLMPPHNLGESRHLLANQERHPLLGRGSLALAAPGEVERAREQWKIAATFSPVTFRR